MQRHQTIVIGAGVTGLAFANAINQQEQGDADILILERETEIGGWCRTVERDGFVWDYSGHFFHFRRPEIEAWLRERMPDDEIRSVTKRATIRLGDSEIEFPFQKNIHQLPREDFLTCLHDLHFAEGGEDFPHLEAMLLGRFGRGICDRFLLPYNRKLYATDLARLDADAMGRFFPHADEDEIIANFLRAADDSYNATFTYPRRGAIRYVQALAHDLPESAIRTSSEVVAIDLDDRVVTLADGTRIGYQQLLSSMPLDRLLTVCGVSVDPDLFAANKVLVFNLGFDRKGPTGVHWTYVPDEEIVFYRVGFYDNIFETDRMSLYVEVGLDRSADVDEQETLDRVLADLGRLGVVDDHQLVAHHSVMLDPAYCHITSASRAAVDEYRLLLATGGVLTAGRYGAWTYCSIEDNIVEARELADLINRKTINRKRIDCRRIKGETP